MFNWSCTVILLRRKMDQDELMRILKSLQRRERIEALGEASLRILSGIGKDEDLHNLFFHWLRTGPLSTGEIHRAAAALRPMSFEERLRALDVLTSAIYTASSHLPEPQRAVLLNYVLWFVYLVGGLSREHPEQ